MKSSLLIEWMKTLTARLYFTTITMSIKVIFVATSFADIIAHTLIRSSWGIDYIINLRMLLLRILMIFAYYEEIIIIILNLLLYIFLRRFYWVLCLIHIYSLFLILIFNSLIYHWITSTPINCTRIWRLLAIKFLQVLFAFVYNSFQIQGDFFLVW